jgi:hypothetical protein
MRSIRLTAIAAALALAVALGAGAADASTRCVYCGSYHGSTKDAVDPAGFTSGGGPFGFVVKRTGVVAVTAKVTWNCSTGDGYFAEALHIDKTFPARPARVTKKGTVYVDRYFGDLHVSFDGHIDKKGKYKGLFAVGYLANGRGCGTATLPATAKKK